MITTATDYLCGAAIARAESKRTRKRFVALSCFVNLGILGAFKYFGFFVDSFIDLFAMFGVNSNVTTIEILLPVGISFYTFQSLSYTIDVYRKQVEPARNILDYALYVAMFPQLVAGPIERAKHLLPQILAPRTFSRERFREGVVLIALGAFKKLFIADNLGAIVDPVFAPNADPTGGQILVAGYAFLFQVYADFSAYTDIARGVSKFMGFELMENFRAPYFARNVQEFWNRWHISLTSWIRDYLYYPLALSRIAGRSMSPAVVTMITFTLMGLWHGAAWGYVMWGVYNGIVLAAFGIYARPIRRLVGRISKQPIGKYAWHGIAILLTFHVILIGDIFFRSGSLDQALTYVALLVSDPGMDLEMLGRASFYIVPAIAIDLAGLRQRPEQRLATLSPALKAGLAYVLLFSVIKWGTTSPTFIYFQF